MFFLQGFWNLLQAHGHLEDAKWFPKPNKPRSGVQETESSQMETLYPHPLPRMSEGQEAIDFNSPWKGGGGLVQEDNRALPLSLSPPDPGDSKWSSSVAGKAYQLGVRAYLSSSLGFVTQLGRSSWTSHFISLSLTFHISKVAITILVATWGCYEN